MFHIARNAFSLALMILTSGLTVSWADVIQPTVVLPPAAGAYTLGGICISALSRCTANATVSGFSPITHTVVNGDELVLVNATYSADIFMENNGAPDGFLGHLLLLGTANFTYVGRDPSVNPLGTFTTRLIDFDFTGTLNGNTFEIRQDASKTSSGFTTIHEATFVGPITYSVSSSLEIFAEYSFNGSPFQPAPGRTTILNAIPEPASGILAGSVLAGLLGLASRRRRVR